MPGHNTMKQNGGWTVELINPIGDLTEISFGPIGLNHAVRWADGSIPSSMALMAELSGVKELKLRELTYPDVDRVIFAYTQILPAAMRKDFVEGVRPLVTPMEDLNLQGESDPINPLFPAVAGPVKRFPAAVDDSGSGLDMNVPAAAKQVSL